jgi:FkbM family methyltransferase
MDLELALMVSLTRHFPRVRGAGAAADLLKRVYLRKNRGLVDADVFGMTMRLDPRECVDGGILFYPHLYERTERVFMQEHLRPADCFLDVGANIGFYSLLASRAVGAYGRVIAIEADPTNCDKLRGNLELNGIKNVTAVCVGVSDKRETLGLGINTTGNRGGNSFLCEGRVTIPVECEPLSGILEQCGVRAIAGAKFDIEGFEYRVLRRFFNDVGPELYPQFLIVEQNRTLSDVSDGDVIDLLVSRGYEEAWSGRLNHILILRR